MMTQRSSLALATWLLREHPGVFATILNTTGKPKAKIAGLGDDETDASIDPNLNYTPDFNIGSDQLDFSVSPDLNIDTSAADATTPSIVSSLGSDIGSAVSSVASFLLKGVATVAPVAVAAFNAKTAVVNNQTQMAVLAGQLARANAGLAPANVAYTANGTPIYIPTASTTGGLTTIPAGLGSPVTLPNGQVGYTLTPQALANLQPTFLQQYGLYVIGGGAALALFLLLS